MRVVRGVLSAVAAVAVAMPESYRGNGSSVAAVGIEQSRTEQKTRLEQSCFFGLNEGDFLTG